MQDPVASFAGRSASPGLATAGVQDRGLVLGRGVRRPGPGGRAARAATGRPPPGPGSPATAAWPTCSAPPGPQPPFAFVVCEDIERSARDNYNSLKLEQRTPDKGIAIFATDEPFNVQGVNATTILVRRVKQGVANGTGCN